VYLYDIKIWSKSYGEKDGGIMELLVQYQAYIALAIIWTTVWKGLALWRAARLKQVGWFVALVMINTVGLFEITYLIATRKTVLVETKNSRS